MARGLPLDLRHRVVRATEDGSDVSSSGGAVIDPVNSPTCANPLQRRGLATQTDETWAMDCVHVQLATDRKIRILTIVDTGSRFSPAIDPRFRYRGEDVLQGTDLSRNRLSAGLASRLQRSPPA
ncbi:MAG: hypothetical protein AcusKO_47720 [Acuticoccus sp.]